MTESIEVSKESVLNAQDDEPEEEPLDYSNSAEKVRLDIIRQYIEDEIEKKIPKKSRGKSIKKTQIEDGLEYKPSPRSVTEIEDGEIDEENVLEDHDIEDEVSDENDDDDDEEEEVEVQTPPPRKKVKLVPPKRPTKKSMDKIQNQYQPRRRDVAKKIIFV